MNKIKFIFLCGLFVPFMMHAQGSISGKITDAETGKSLPGAHIMLAGNQKATSADADGWYQLDDLQKGRYELTISFLGYASKALVVQIDQATTVDVALEPRAFISEECIVSALRVDNAHPTTFTDINREQIQLQNTGQDLPFVIAMTPSVVVTSDAGTGIGYTNFSIRGTDVSRINLTLNGVPMNDAESHSVYFVDLPDLATSLDNIQIQRGVGTSTNGAAAFGASVNLQTKKLEQSPYALYQGGVGSFNTFRNSVSFGTGLLKNKLALDVRMSKISSDGYIDRARSDLASLYVAAGYYGKKDIVKFTALTGKEETYQAWNGIPKVRLNDDVNGMLDLAADNWWDQETTDHLLQSNNRTYNYYTYDNEVDSYQQDYYQLHYSHAFNQGLNLNTALFYTRGKGYYEQFKDGRKFRDYLLEDVVIGQDTITRTDLVQRKWLDNHFYGFIASLNYTSSRIEVNLGGGWNQYDGGHYGEVIWAQYASNGAIRHRWYENDGLKTDYSIFAKTNYSISEQVSLYADMQFRHINYKITGTHDNLIDISQQHIFNFLNPKAGLVYQLNKGNRLFASFAVAHREPSRTNYRDADSNYEPLPERLIDYELGYTRTSEAYTVGLNVYFMDYKDQLVATGKINNTGDAILTNVAKSYRAGVEFTVAYQLFKRLRWDLNYTFSQNKITDFVQYIDNWDSYSQDSIILGSTNLILSPDHIGASTITYTPLKDFNIYLISKYVGRQYIDNTSNTYNSIDPYFVNDLKFSLSVHPKFIKELRFELLISNFLSEKYETYGWAYNYIYNNEQKVMDGYFPMAPINIMAGLTVRF